MNAEAEAAAGGGGGGDDAQQRLFSLKLKAGKTAWIDANPEQQICLAHACLAIAGDCGPRVALHVKSPKDTEEKKVAPICIFSQPSHLNSRLNLYMNEPNGLFLSGTAKDTEVHIVGHYVPVPAPSLHLPNITMEDLQGLGHDQFVKLLAADLPEDDDEDDDFRESDIDEEDGSGDDDDAENQNPTVTQQMLAQINESPKVIKPTHAGKKPINESSAPKSMDRESKQDLAGPSAKKARVKTENQQESSDTQHAGPKTISTPSGLQYKETLLGDGGKPKPGRDVFVRYTLRLKNGKVVDKSGRTPFRFRLGVGEVIRGWDEGLKTMRVGGQRHLIVPAALGYGKKGAPPDIPGNSTLLFDVELVKAF